MYEYIKGKVVSTSNDYVVIETGSFAYKVFMTNTSLIVGNVEVIYIYYYFNESTRQLYGFKTVIEREVFTKIIGLKSIGIKTAFSILKSDSYEVILNAAFNNNYDYLLTLNKINEKNIDQLIKSLSSIRFNAIFQIDEKYFNALKTLDYNDSEIYKSFSLVNKNQPVNLMIKEGIKIIEKGDL